MLHPFQVHWVHGAQQHQLSYSCADAGLAYRRLHDDREQAVHVVLGLQKVNRASTTTLRGAFGVTSLSNQKTVRTFYLQHVSATERCTCPTRRRAASMR